MAIPLFAAQLLLALVLADASGRIVIEEDPHPSAVRCAALDGAEAGAETVTARLVERTEPSIRLEHKELLTRLELQNAIRSAAKRVEAEDWQRAIELLEPLVTQAEGSETFLEALEAAYRGQMARLINDRRLDEARLIAQRLRVLSPESATDVPAGPIAPASPSAGPVASPPVPKSSKKAAPAGSALGVAQVSTVVPVSQSRPDKVASPGRAEEPKPSESKVSDLLAVAKAAGSALVGKDQTRKRVDAEPVASTPAVKSPSSASGPAALEARAQMDDAADTPLAAQPQAGDQPNGIPAGPLGEAEEHFRAGRFAQALAKYEEAYVADPVGVQAGRERWGYCLLYVSVARYNDMIGGKGPIPNDAAWSDLESDVRLARRLAPSLTYTDTVLEAIGGQRHGAATGRSGQAEQKTSPKSPSVPAASGAPAPAQLAGMEQRTPAPVNQYGGARAAGVPARNLIHLPGKSQSWSVAQTTNFRIYHRDPALAEKVGELAEEARKMAHEKWFAGEPLEDWNPVCEIYLYPTAGEYSAATGVPAFSPGHSKVMNEHGRITSRVLAIRTDDSNMLEAVLPHETAHVVFAGRFGHHAVPRWADEGMAVLTEPRSKQEGHLTNLVQARRTATGFSCGEILGMQDYPAGGRMRDFYAHSVGICRYLVEIGGCAKLIEFLRLSLGGNSYERALQQIYGIDFATLEQQFNQYVATLGGGTPPVATAQR